MNRAFIFDMDGVLVDSERASERVANDFDFFSRIFGKEIADGIGPVIGMTMGKVYERAKELGTTVEREYFIEQSDERGALIYENAAITQGTEQLVDYLLTKSFLLALVTSSTKKSVDLVLPHLPFRDKFKAIISINDTPGLDSKPAPDGYLEALRRLDAEPKRSIVLEDSNRGIESGKAAGCYVIGYREHLISGHEQTGADGYVDTMDDVVKLVEQFIRQ